MSESQVHASHVEEIVTQVLTQLVQDGDDEDQMSVELLQEEGSLSKWHNFLAPYANQRVEESFIAV